MSSVAEAARKRRTAYRSGRLELTVFEPKETDRKVSKKAKRKEARDPLARTPLKWKDWKKG